MEQQALQLQDKYRSVGGNCWGCGPDNEQGLQIKSYWSGDEGICTWEPMHYHTAGGSEFLHGGIIATIIDCHCSYTAWAAAYQSENREFGTEPLIGGVTGSLQVTYLRPIPTNEPVVLRARVKEMKEKKIVVTCSLFSKDEECARGEVVIVRVPVSHFSRAE